MSKQGGATAGVFEAATEQFLGCMWNLPTRIVCLGEYWRRRANGGHQEAKSMAVLVRGNNIIDWQEPSLGSERIARPFGPALLHSLVEEIKTSLPMANLTVQGRRNDLKRESAWW